MTALARIQEILDLGFTAVVVDLDYVFKNQQELEDFLEAPWANILLRDLNKFDIVGLKTGTIFRTRFEWTDEYTGLSRNVLEIYDPTEWKIA